MYCPANRISRSAGAKVFGVLWFHKHFVRPGLKAGATDSTRFVAKL